MLKGPTVGDRVRVMQHHKWMKSQMGIIKELENRIGNNIIVKFDKNLLGMYHDKDGDPCLRLGEFDLEKLNDRPTDSSRLRKTTSRSSGKDKQTKLTKR